MRRPLLRLLYPPRMVDVYGAFAGMKIGKGSESRTAPVSFCTPHIPELESRPPRCEVGNLPLELWHGLASDVTVTCKAGGTEFPHISRCTTESSSKQLQCNVNGQAHKNSSYIYICDAGWEPAAANKGKYAQTVQASGDSAEICNTYRTKN